MGLKFKRADFGERWSHCGDYLVLGPGSCDGTRYTVFHKATVNEHGILNGNGEYVGNFQTVAEAKAAAQSHLNVLKRPDRVGDDGGPTAEDLSHAPGDILSSLKIEVISSDPKVKATIEQGLIEGIAGGKLGG